MADPIQPEGAPAPRTPMLVTCTACRHVWPAAWLPMAMETLGKMMVKACPSCGAEGGILAMACFERGDLDRYVEQLTAELKRAMSALITLRVERDTAEKRERKRDDP